jgi:hypothetical protein
MQSAPEQAQQEKSSKPKAIRNFRKDKTRKTSKKVDEFLRHPFILLITGFFLTGGLASGVSYIVGRIDTAKLRHTEQLTSERNALDQFTQDLAAWHIRANLLLRSIQNGLSDAEVEQAKRDYDKSYIQIVGPHVKTTKLFAYAWNAAHTGSSADQVFVSSTTAFRTTIEAADKCLNAAYMRSAKHIKAPIEDADCKYTKISYSSPKAASGVYALEYHIAILQQVIDAAESCGNSVADEIRPFDFGEASVAEISEQFHLRENLAEHMRQNCTIVDRTVTE